MVIASTRRALVLRKNRLLAKCADDMTDQDMAFLNPWRVCGWYTQGVVTNVPKRTRDAAKGHGRESILRSPKRDRKVDGRNVPLSSRT